MENPNLAAMRTEFGQRLFDARTHAELTQTQLCKIVGMSQGTYGELERAGSSSSYTPAIATACGVDVSWLAYGRGEMLLPKDREHQENSPPKITQEGLTNHRSIPSVEAACNALAQYFDEMNDADREAAAGWLSGLARRPASAPYVIGALTDMVTHTKQITPEKSTGTK